MGREVRRVPVDWDWPVGKTWEGFLMPEALGLPKCGTCDGRGYRPTAQWIEGIVHLLLMLGRADLRDLHPWLTGLPIRPPVPPDHEAAVAFTTGLAGRAPFGAMGHDAIDSHHALLAVVRAAGLPEDWALCPTCDGNGDVGTPEQRAAVDAWERTPPPAGDGWQVWETVGEGSPITPVFPTAEALVEHLATVGTTWDHEPWRRTAAKRFVADGWAPSFISLGRGPLLAGGNDADLIAAVSDRP